MQSPEFCWVQILGSPGIKEMPSGQELEELDILVINFVAYYIISFGQ